MKNITFLFFLMGGVLFAQQPKSFSELSSQNQINEFNGETATIISNGAQGIIATYVAKVLFDIGLDENYFKSNISAILWTCRSSCGNLYFSTSKCIDTLLFLNQAVYL